jgi:hypothetical protein
VCAGILFWRKKTTILCDYPEYLARNSKHHKSTGKTGIHMGKRGREYRSFNVISVLAKKEEKISF